MKTTCAAVDRLCRNAMTPSTRFDRQARSCWLQMLPRLACFERHPWPLFPMICSIVRILKRQNCPATGSPRITQSLCTLACKFVERESSQNPIFIRIDESKRPCPAPIRRLIQAGSFPRPACHHNRRLRIPRLHAAKIQRCSILLRIRHSALRPMRAAVDGPQHSPARSTCPRHRAAHRINSTQPRRCSRLLHLPDRARRTPHLRPRTNRRTHNHDNQPARPSNLHSPQYSSAGRPVRESDHSELKAKGL